MIVAIDHERSQGSERLTTDYNIALMVGAGLSFTAALLHLGVIAGGPAWYDRLGAGKRFVRAAEAGKRYPAIITLGIAAVLTGFGVYALSGAGVVPPLPTLRPALCAITLCYLVRGIAGPVALRGSGRSPRFIWVSSGICLIYGVSHGIGLAQVWDLIGQR